MSHTPRSLLSISVDSLTFLLTATRWLSELLASRPYPLTFKGRKKISSGEGSGKERPGFDRGEASCVCLFLLRREHYRRLHQCPLTSPLADIGLHVISKEFEKWLSISIYCETWLASKEGDGVIGGQSEHHRPRKSLWILVPPGRGYWLSCYWSLSSLNTDSLPPFPSRSIFRSDEAGKGI